VSVAVGAAVAVGSGVAVGGGVSVGSGISVGTGVEVGSAVAVGAWAGMSVLLTAVVGSACTVGVFPTGGSADAAARGAEAVSVACTALATKSGSGVGLAHPLRAILRTMMITMKPFTM
jgi:hypothetical protein